MAPLRGIVASSSPSSSLLERGGKGPEAVASSLAQAEGNSSIIYHSEVMLCPRASFTAVQQAALDRHPTNPYSKLPEQWWEPINTVMCRALPYGGVDDSRNCSGVSVVPTFMSARSRGPYHRVTKYFYGRTTHDVQSVYNEVCTCGWKWSGKAYSLLNHNCNTFSKTLMSCVLGLSDSQ